MIDRPRPDEDTHSLVAVLKLIAGPLLLVVAIVLVVVGLVVGV